MNARSMPAITYSAIVCGLTLVSLTARAVSEELKVLYRNETELTASLPGSAIDWVTVTDSGNLIEQKVDLSEIESLTLAPGKSSELLSQVRQHISRLGDADYLVRENAERALALQGGQFRDLLKRLEDSPNFEIRHRVARLLKNFSKRTYPPLQLDTLILSNGRTLEGEARNFSLAGQYRSTPIALDRKSVARLFRSKSGGAGVGQPEGEDHRNDVAGKTRARAPVKTTIFHKHSDFARPGQQEFTFETDAEGQPFRDRANVDAAFVESGLLFRNEQTGYVGVSVFSFKYAGLPVGGRSVCLYGQGRGRKQFQGFMEIRFCVPGNPNAPAGVKEFGMFIARVKHSRDIVMEAYNAQGDVLATVEATDQQCVFAGVKSNELITRLRIFSSPWLEKLSRKIDVDFAIDTLRMSAPIPVQRVFGLPTKRRRVELTNGDRINPPTIITNAAGELRVSLSGVSKRPSPIVIKQDEIASIRMGSRVAENLGWKAMLEDGSVVTVSPGNELESELLGEKFQLSDLIALWPGTSPARYPIDGDWKPGQALVVFPTCRIQTNPLKLGRRGISWTAKKKLQQTLMLDREDPTKKENQEDPTPSKSSFGYNEINAAQLPTFWIGQPSSVATGREIGVVELNDGQRFLFGDGRPFELASLKNHKVELTWMEAKPVVIPFKDIRTVVFPQ